MTEILVTRTLSLTQSINQINIFLKLKPMKYSYLSILAAVFGFLKFELKKKVQVSQCGETAITFYCKFSPNVSTIRVRQACRISTYAPTKFEAAMSKGLGRNAFARNI